MYKICLAIGYNELEEYIKKMQPMMEKKFGDTVQFVGVCVYREAVMQVVKEYHPDILVLREGLQGSLSLTDLVYQIKVISPSTRIVFIAGDRKPGDAFLATLVQYGVYDILVGSSVNVKDILKLITFPNGFADVANYMPKLSVDETTNKQLYESPDVELLSKHAENEIEDENNLPVKPLHDVQKPLEEPKQKPVTPEPKAELQVDMKKKPVAEEKTETESIKEPVKEEPVSKPTKKPSRKPRLFEKKTEKEQPIVPTQNEDTPSNPEPPLVKQSKPIAPTPEPVKKEDSGIALNMSKPAIQKPVEPVKEEPSEPTPIPVHNASVEPVAQPVATPVAPTQAPVTPMPSVQPVQSQQVPTYNMGQQVPPYYEQPQQQTIPPYPQPMMQGVPMGQPVSHEQGLNQGIPVYDTSSYIPRQTQPAPQESKKGLFGKKSTQKTVSQQILTFMGGRHGCGNSQTAFHVSLNLADTGYRVLYVDLNDTFSSIESVYQMGFDDIGLDMALYALERGDYPHIKTCISSPSISMEITEKDDDLYKTYAKLPNSLEMLFFSQKEMNKTSKYTYNPELLKELDMFLLMNFGYDFIILDAPSNIHNKLTETALIYCNKIFFTLTQDKPDLYYYIHNMNELNRKKIAYFDKCHYIVNKYQNTKVKTTDIKELITENLKFNSFNMITLPNISADMINSNFNGIPVTWTTKDKSYMKGIQEITSIILN